MTPIKTNILSANSNAAIQPANDKRSKEKLSLKVGDMVSALITEKQNGKVKLEFGEGVFKNKIQEFSENSVKGELGERIFFEVQNDGQDAVDGGVTLKQVFPETPSADKRFAKELIKQSSAKDTKELMLQSKFIEEDENVLSVKSPIKTAQELNNEIHMKTKQVISKIKNQINYAVNNVNHAAIAELIANGVNLDKISLDVLNTVVSEIETDPIPQITVSNGDLPAEALDTLDMPHTSDNLNALNEADKKITEIAALPETGIVKLLKDNKPLTLENIYKVKYQSMGAANTLSRDIMQQLSDSVKKIFQSEDIEETDETLNTAELLIANDIDLTKQNIDKAVFLSNLSTIGTNRRELLLSAAKSIKEGKSAVDFDVYESLKIKNITAQRQTAERQHKSINEAIQNLAGTGIEIDSEPVTETLNRLRAEEEALLKGIRVDDTENTAHSLFAKSLRQMGADDNSENVSKMAAAFGKVKYLAYMTYHTFADVAQSKIAFTIDSLSETIKGHMQTAAQDTSEKYAVFTTVPNPKYGDSFRKITEQIKPLLETLNIEPTVQNIKAAKILTQNQLDVTYENILRIKDIDAKIEAVRNNFHPLIAADMIKRGADPSQTDIDELLSQIESFKGVYGTTKGEKLAKYIYEMDRSSTDSQSQSFAEREQIRTRMLDIYRMLDKLQRNDGKALGAFLQVNADFTLSNLVKFSKGYKTSAKLTENSKSTENKPRKSYAASLVSSFVDESRPAELRRLLESIGSGDISVEEALNRMTRKSTVPTEQPQATNDYQNHNEIEIEQYLKKLLEFQQTPPMTIKFMQDNQIPINIMNTEIMRSFGKNQSFFKDELKKIEDELESAGETGIFEDADLNTLKSGETPAAVTSRFASALDELRDKTDKTQTIEQIDLIKRTLLLQEHMNGLGNAQRFPVKLNQKLTEVYMYVINDEIDLKNEVTIAMSLDLGFGNVSADIMINGNKVSLTVNCNDASAEELMNGNLDFLTNRLKESGYKLDEVRFR